MKKTFLLRIAVIIAVLVFNFCNVFAQTTILGGNVSGTWTLAGSPYNIQGSIMIPNDSTLTIGPGVIVNFQGTYKLYVLGRLLAIGTTTDSIIFTAASTSNGWRGIRFENTAATNDTSKIMYCKLLYGKATGTGNDANGGALFFSNFSKATINNSLISNCTANSTGGGISCWNSSNPTFNNNTISNNSSGGDGGGFYIDNSSPTINHNTISYNTCAGSYGGGGIHIEYGSSTICNNIISNNFSGVYGGGIFAGSCNGTTISNNIISNNSSSYDGGGINVFFDSPTISNNTILNNSSGGNGGGIYCLASNSVFTNNTIADNIALKGGALCTQSSSPTLLNCILWGNNASISGVQVFLNDEASDPNFYYCDVQGASAAFELNGNFYLGIYQNNINTNPLFVSSSDWSLQAGSPCIDTGDPSGSYPAIDLAGNPRIIEVIACIIDMGAYENQSGVSCLTSIQFLTSNEQIQITIFPNPASDFVTLNIDNRNNADLSLNIYNVFGELVRSELLKQNQQQINIGDLNNGIYMVEIKSKDWTEKQKLIIQR